MRHGLIALILAGCGTHTANPTIDDPLNEFYAIEAVQVFPAHIGSDGAVLGRVCGAPLDPSDANLPAEPTPGDANGLEVSVNFLSAGRFDDACTENAVFSIRPGDEIEYKLLELGNTIGSSNFQFNLRVKILDEQLFEMLREFVVVCANI